MLLNILWDTVAQQPRPSTRGKARLSLLSFSAGVPWCTGCMYRYGKYHQSSPPRMTPVNFTGGTCAVVRGKWRLSVNGLTPCAGCTAITNKAYRYARNTERRHCLTVRQRFPKKKQNRDLCCPLLNYGLATRDSDDREHQTHRNTLKHHGDGLAAR